jgi:hypothetical protein
LETALCRFLHELREEPLIFVTILCVSELFAYYIELYTSDSLCDDGGPGAEYADCIYGTDCADCGPRFPPPPPICAPRRATGLPTPIATTACGPGSEFRPAPGRRHVYHCASSQVVR